MFEIHKIAETAAFGGIAPVAWITSEFTEDPTNPIIPKTIPIEYTRRMFIFLLNIPAMNGPASAAATAPTVNVVPIIVWSPPVHTCQSEPTNTPVRLSATQYGNIWKQKQPTRTIHIHMFLSFFDFSIT